MNLYVNAAAPKEPTTTMTLATTEMAGVMAALKTINGQCHRYQEYERAPRYCMARQSSSTQTPRRGSALPAASTAAVPNAGMAASHPGKPEPSAMKNAGSRMADSPLQPTIVQAAWPSFGGLATESSPPRPNSHARAGSS